jgi:hypothetical protein
MPGECRTFALEYRLRAIETIIKDHLPKSGRYNGAAGLLQKCSGAVDEPFCTGAPERTTYSEIPICVRDVGSQL